MTYDHGELATVGKLFGAWLIDGVLQLLTLGIGWLIWGAFTAANGQTPAKQLLNLQVVDQRTGQPLSWAQMVLLRGIVGGIVMYIAGAVIIGLVLLFMPLWDDRNQSVWSKISSSVVVEMNRG